MNFLSKKEDKKDVASSVGKRRKFLSGAAGAGAVALGFPMVAKGQATPVAMRWQSTWPAKDIFHEYANDFAKKIKTYRRRTPVEVLRGRRVPPLSSTV